MNWKLDIDLPKRCRRFRQKCNLLFDGPPSKRVTIFSIHGNLTKTRIEERPRRILEALRKTRCTASKLYPKPILSPEFTTKRSNTQRFPHQSQTNLELRVSSRSTRSTHARQLVFGTKSEIVRKKCMQAWDSVQFLSCLFGHSVTLFCCCFFIEIY